MTRPTANSLFLFSILPIFAEVIIYHPQQTVIQNQGEEHLLQAIAFLQQPEIVDQDLNQLPEVATYLQQFKQTCDLFVKAELTN